MLVYRLCSELECKNILNGVSFNEIGHYCEKDSRKNNHQYVEGKKYIHFFEYKDCLLYLNLSKGRFICTYDIPESIVSKGRGIGKYLDPFFNRTLESVIEVALPSEEMIFEYLRSVDLITEDIDPEDYGDNQLFMGCTRNIYTADDTKTIDEAKKYFKSDK